MIPRGRLVLLDTNVLLLLIRGRAQGDWIDTTFALRERPEAPLVSTVSLGELHRLAARAGRSWGEGRHRALEQLTREFVLVDLGDPGVPQRYGEIGAYLDDTGQPVPQNDVWIAATASAREAVLLTTDRDFDRLHPRHVERVYVDPATLPRGG